MHPNPQAQSSDTAELLRELAEAPDAVRILERLRGIHPPSEDGSLVAPVSLLMGIDALSEAILLTDRRGMVLHASARLESLCGISASEIQGHSVLALQARVPYRSKLRRLLDEVFTRGKSEDRILLRRVPIPQDEDSRECIWGAVSVGEILGPKERRLGFVISIRDVTDQVHREEVQAARRRGAEIKAGLSQLLQTPAPLEEHLGDALRYVMMVSELPSLQQRGVIYTRQVAHEGYLPCVSEGLDACAIQRLAQILDLEGQSRDDADFLEEVLLVDSCECTIGGEDFDCFTHGHYLIPCQANGETLGVLALFAGAPPVADAILHEALFEIGRMVGLAIASDLATQERRRAREAAEASMRAKAEFMTNVTHELRTPLNGVLGMASLLQSMQPSADQEEVIDTILSSAEALLGIVEDLLDFSKLEKRGLEIQDRVFPLSDCIDGAIKFVEIQAADKGLALAVEISEALPQEFVGDGGRIRQVLVNLLANAVKFTDHGSVRLSVRGHPVPMSEDWELQFEVKDTGIGIAEHDQELIFDSFAQVDGSVTRRAGGTGLGLAITRELVSLMGGQVWVDSEVGEGSTFTCTVRVRREHALTARPGCC